ncbi:MAG: hypothetical protein KC733_09705 [Candidatus Omnitrophica bacterium]|nr:hypothetical protein [Candidatus Omnitrophota bacterium]
MFSDADYYRYFQALEDLLKEILTIDTDFMNELIQAHIRSIFHVILDEDMDCLEYILREKMKFDRSTDLEA